jgi:hypothetical protein
LKKNHLLVHICFLSHNDEPTLSSTASFIAMVPFYGTRLGSPFKASACKVLLHSVAFGACPVASICEIMRQLMPTVRRCSVTPVNLTTYLAISHLYQIRTYFKKITALNAAFTVVSTHQTTLGPRGGLWPVLLMCIIHVKGLCPSSGDINRLMMM